MHVPLCDKYLSWSGDYVEKESDSSTIKSDHFVLELKVKNPKHRHCEFIF
jgi:hypothetical protein